MHASPRMLLAIPLTLLLLVAGFTPAGATPTSKCTSARQADGTSSWVGEPSEKVSAAALALATIVDENPDSYAGVEYCGNYTGVKIYVKAGKPASEVAALRKQFNGKLIFTVPVSQSRNELAAATEEIAMSAANSKATVSVTPDPSTGEVMVEQTGSSSWKAPKSKAKIKLVKKPAVTSDTTAASRQADAAPFTSGAHIETTKAVCSVGPRIKVNGVYRVLTAGHCGSGAWYARNAFSPTSANLVGTTVTTSWPGNAYRYGDWQLLGGKTYSGMVYGNGTNTSTRLPGNNLNFNPLPLGHKLCSSGQTTGMLCYYTVSGVNSSRVVNGVMVGQTTWMTTGRGCSLGFGSGDSGGAMFYNNGTGKMIYVGLVTSFNTTECTFRFTQLSGVRKWNSTASW